MSHASDMGIFVGTAVRLNYNEGDLGDVGSIVYLKTDDHSRCPLFENDTGYSQYTDLDRVELAPVGSTVIEMAENGMTKKQEAAYLCFTNMLKKATAHREGRSVDGEFQTCYGICDNIEESRVSRDHSYDMLTMVKDNLIRRTPSFSGNYHFPVPHPEKLGDVDAAHTAWDNARNKWEGEYGALRVQQLKELIDIIENNWDESYVRNMTPATRLGIIKDQTVVIYSRDGKMYKLHTDDGSTDPYFMPLTNPSADRRAIDLRYVKVVSVTDFDKDSRSVAQFLADIDSKAAELAELNKKLAELQALIGQTEQDIGMLDYGLAVVHKVQRLSK